LLPTAKLFDMGIARAKVQFQIAGFGLGFAQIAGGELVLLREIVDPAFLNADILGGDFKSALRLAQLLVYLKQLDQRDVRRTHAVLPLV
jgi:hypothetical protein